MQSEIALNALLLGRSVLSKMHRLAIRCKLGRKLCPRLPAKGVQLLKA